MRDFQVLDSCLDCSEKAVVQCILCNQTHWCSVEHQINTLEEHLAHCNGISHNIDWERARNKLRADAMTCLMDARHDDAFVLGLYSLGMSKSLGSSPSEMILDCLLLSKLRITADDTDSCLHYLRACVTLLRDNPFEDVRANTRVCSGLVELLLDQDKTKEAEHLAQSFTTLMKNRYGDNHFSVGDCLSMVARCHQKGHKTAEALEFQKKALEIQAKHRRDSSSEESFAKSKVAAAKMALASKKPEEALKYFRDGRDAFKKLKQRLSQAEAEEGMAASQIMLNKPLDALDNLESSLGICRAILGKSHVKTRELRERVHKLRDRFGINHALDSEDEDEESLDEIQIDASEKRKSMAQPEEMFSKVLGFMREAVNGPTISSGGTNQKRLKRRRSASLAALDVWDEIIREDNTNATTTAAGSNNTGNTAMINESRPNNSNDVNSFPMEGGIQEVESENDSDESIIERHYDSQTGMVHSISSPPKRGRKSRRSLRTNSPPHHLIPPSIHDIGSPSGGGISSGSPSKRRHHGTPRTVTSMLGHNISVQRLVADSDESSDDDMRSYASGAMMLNGHAANGGNGGFAMEGGFGRSRVFSGGNDSEIMSVGTPRHGVMAMEGNFSPSTPQRNKRNQFRTDQFGYMIGDGYSGGFEGTGGYSADVELGNTSGGGFGDNSGGGIGFEGNFNAVNNGIGSASGGIGMMSSGNGSGANSFGMEGISNGVNGIGMMGSGNGFGGDSAGFEMVALAGNDSSLQLIELGDGPALGSADGLVGNAGAMAMEFGSGGTSMMGSDPLGASGLGLPGNDNNMGSSGLGMEGGFGSNGGLAAATAIGSMGFDGFGAPSAGGSGDFGVGGLSNADGFGNQTDSFPMAGGNDTGFNEGPTLGNSSSPAPSGIGGMGMAGGFNDDFGGNNGGVNAMGMEGMGPGFGSSNQPASSPLQTQNQMYQQQQQQQQHQQDSLARLSAFPDEAVDVALDSLKGPQQQQQGEEQMDKVFDTFQAFGFGDGLFGLGSFLAPQDNDLRDLAMQAHEETIMQTFQSLDDMANVSLAFGEDGDLMTDQWFESADGNNGFSGFSGNGEVDKPKQQQSDVSNKHMSLDMPPIPVIPPSVAFGGGNGNGDYDHGSSHAHGGNYVNNSYGDTTAAAIAGDGEQTTIYYDENGNAITYDQMGQPIVTGNNNNGTQSDFNLTEEQYQQYQQQQDQQYISQEQYEQYQQQQQQQYITPEQYQQYQQQQQQQYVTQEQYEQYQQQQQQQDDQKVLTSEEYEKYQNYQKQKGNDVLSQTIDKISEMQISSEAKSQTQTPNNEPSSATATKHAASPNTPIPPPPMGIAPSDNQLPGIPSPIPVNLVEKSNALSNGNQQGNSSVPNTPTLPGSGNNGLLMEPQPLTPVPQPSTPIGKSSSIEPSTPVSARATLQGPITPLASINTRHQRRFSSTERTPSSPSMPLPPKLSASKKGSRPSSTRRYSATELRDAMSMINAKAGSEVVPPELKNFISSASNMTGGLSTTQLASILQQVSAGKKPRLPQERPKTMAPFGRSNGPSLGGSIGPNTSPAPKTSNVRQSTGPRGRPGSIYIPSSTTASSDVNGVKQPGLKRTIRNATGRRLKVLAMSGSELWNDMKFKLLSLGLMLGSVKKKAANTVALKLLPLGMMLVNLRKKKMQQRAIKCLSLGLYVQSYRRKLAGKLKYKILALGLMQVNLLSHIQEKTYVLQQARMNAGQKRPQAPRLRNIHWDVLRNIDNTIWQNSSLTDADAISNMIGNLFPDLDSTFGQVTRKPAAKKAGGGGSAAPAAKAKKIKLLSDSKRAQNLIIGIRGTFSRKPFPEIATLVIDMDADKLGLDGIETLVNWTPTNEEIGTLRSYKGDASQLEDCEQYVHAMMNIPSLAARLECMQFMVTFRPNLLTLKEYVDTITTAISEVLDNEDFRRFLVDIVLPVGNILNAGTRKVATGLKLSSLMKLSTTKSGDNKKTLLMYILMKLEDHEDTKKILNLPSMFPCSYEMVRTSFETKEGDFTKLKRGIAKIEAQLKQAKTNLDSMSPTDARTQAFETFVSVMEPFLARALLQYQKLEDRFARITKDRFPTLIRYFADDSKKPEDLFQKLAKFFDEFKATKEKIEMFKMKEARAKKKAAQKKKKR